jgi:hypothetical protein
VRSRDQIGRDKNLFPNFFDHSAAQSCCVGRIRCHVKVKAPGAGTSQGPSSQVQVGEWNLALSAMVEVTSSFVEHGIAKNRLSVREQYDPSVLRDLMIAIAVDRRLSEDIRV